MSTSPKRPMSPDEIEAVKMLRGVSYPIATFDKKLGATVQLLISYPPPVCDCGVEARLSTMPHEPSCPVSKAEAFVPMIPEKMVPQLWRLVCRYRRQIRHPERVKYIRMAEVLQTKNPKKRAEGLKILKRREKDRAKRAAKKAKAVSA